MICKHHKSEAVLLWYMSCKTLEQIALLRSNFIIS